MIALTDDFEDGIQFTLDKWHRYNLESGADPAPSGPPDPRNYVATSVEQAHAGTLSLKCYTAQDLVLQQKAALGRELLNFPAGTDFWFSAWYNIPSGSSLESLYIFELEATAADYVGRRLAFDANDALWIAAKLGTGVDFFQSTPVPFPRDQWVSVRLHLRLGANGLAELWQNDQLLISAAGRNIPDGVTYDWISVGQTNNASHRTQTVFVDDVVVSDAAMVAVDVDAPPIVPSRGRQNSGDLDTSQSVFPIIYCLTRFLVEDHERLRLVDWNDPRFPIESRDPSHPAEGQVWLTP